MAGRLNFSITLNLLIDNFKKASGNVKSSFASMQAQAISFAAALGATTLSIGSFVSQIISVVRETSRANTALKNVSESTSSFAKNLKFTTDLANKYGVYVNDVTSNFAKFSAASNSAGVAMKDQQKTFEALSRASSAFGLSADDTNGVFLAVTQMMSKGKIQAEELRGQLGERLPIAMAAMAKAAGVPIQKLDKLMKDGKLLSADVIPKLADAINEMLPNVDTDNIETSLNRLKNAFQEFANNTGVKDAYKSLIDGITELVRTAGENIKYIVSGVAAFIEAAVLAKFVKWFMAQMAVARKQAQAEAANVAKAAGQSFDVIAWKSKNFGAIMSRTFVNIGRAIKSAFISILPLAILTGVFELISYLRKANEEAERVRSIYSDYKKEAASVTHTSEIIQLQTLQKLYNDAAGNAKMQEQYHKRIESVLGEQISKNQSINDIIAERIKLLEATAKADFYTQRKIEAEDKISKLTTDSGLGGTNLKYLAGLKQTDYSKYWERMTKITGESSFLPGTKNRDISNIIDEYIQNQKIVSDATSNLEEAMKYVVENDQKKPPIASDDDKKKKETPLQKEQKSYDKQYAELSAELEIGKITQAEYNKALGELNIKMYAQAKGTGNKEVLESKYFEGLKEAAEKAIKNQDRNAGLVEFEKVQKDYNDKVAEAKAQHAKGVITQKSLNEKLSELSFNAAASTASIKGVDDAAGEFIKSMLHAANEYKNPITARMKKRDTTYDYKKNASDIAEENYNLAKDYAGELKTQLSDKIGDMMDELNRAMDDADFSEALKIAEAIDGTGKLQDAIEKVKTSSKKLAFETLKKDIKEINKDLRDSTYSGIKDIASSSDRVVSAWQNLNDVMSNVDSSGWERIMALWNAMTNTIDSFLSIIKTIETITELTNKLAKAKEQEAVIDTATTATKATNAVTEATAEATALGTQTAAELLASSTKTTAATTEMAAKSTAAYAYIPFAGVGLAASQIAAMQALIAASSIPKFATGGIMPKTGDKMLARVNPGEMILNDGQQSRLFQMLDSGLSGSGKSNITIGFDKVRGSDIYLSLKNYMKSTNKKI